MALPQETTANTNQAPESHGRVVMTKIFVTGLKIDAEIGVYAHEKGRAQPLIADVELDVPSAGVEKLSDTVNYEMIGKAARAIAAEGHIHLVEAFAEKLARARVRVEKPMALAPHANSAGVEITVVRG